MKSSTRSYNRLFDPKEFAGKNVLVVGGGDSALETAIALGACGAHVTLSYRKKEFSRPKPENIEKLRALEQDAANPVQIENPTQRASQHRGDARDAKGNADRLGEAAARLDGREHHAPKP